MDLPLLSRLRKSDRRRIEGLLFREWALPAGDESMSALQDHEVGGYFLMVLIGPKNTVGARYFQLLLRDEEDRLCDHAFALGLHNKGAFPGYNWIELIKCNSRPCFEGKPVDIHQRRMDEALFRLLAGLVPDGGHIMVEYESPSQEPTARILSLGYPAITSPLGYILFRAGCRSFRDWYIAEGGLEGPRKLQAFKPPDEATARSKTEQLRRELGELLAKPEVASHGEWGRLARKLGREAMQAIEKGTRNDG